MQFIIWVISALGKSKSNVRPRSSANLLMTEWSTSMSRSGPRNCWRQLSYAIKNQLGHPKPPTRGFGTQNTSIRGHFACSSLVLYGIRELVPAIPRTTPRHWGGELWGNYRGEKWEENFLCALQDRPGSWGEEKEEKWSGEEKAGRRECGLNVGL